MLRPLDRHLSRSRNVRLCERKTRSLRTIPKFLKSNYCGKRVGLTGKGYDGVHRNGMNGFAVGSDDGQCVTLERDLCRTDGSEGIDKSETITASRRYRENFERRVGHETGVWILRLRSVDELRGHRIFITRTRIYARISGKKEKAAHAKLSLSIDENAFRCLTGING